MQVPLELTFRGMDRSAPIEERIREKVDGLEKFYDRITSCHIVVESPHHHQNKGAIYRVMIDLRVPGKEIVVGRESGKDHSHEDVLVAIRDAFDAARRQLQDYIRTRRGHVKVHEEPPHGRIARLFVDEGYGFIESPDGRDIYFHENALADDLKMQDLETGAAVRYTEEQGEEGAQATIVRTMGRHHQLD
jgi:cold shock CspA family protein/ribosome-associated translation inhibitor RaiA